VDPRTLKPPEHVQIESRPLQLSQGPIDACAPVS
jgi:hypothetical protein